MTENKLDVTTDVGCIESMTADLIDTGKLEFFFVGKTKHFGSVGCGNEFTFLVEKLQCIPLGWIMAGSKNDATTGLLDHDGQFCGWCGRQSNINHVEAE